MAVSIFDLFSIGIGPSSSHTVGPMRAAGKFIEHVLELPTQTSRIKTELFGSLGHTGKGHGSDVAILLGLEGAQPEVIDTDSISARINLIRSKQQINLNNQLLIQFNEKNDLYTPT